MDKSMYFSIAAMVSGSVGIGTGVAYQNFWYFIAGISGAIIIFALSPQKKKKQQQS